jgi:3-phosphoglycerate kinase
MENIIESQNNDTQYLLEELEKAVIRLDHFSKLDNHGRKESYRLRHIVEALKDRLLKNPKPTTNLLANQINQALKDNPYGGGVVVRVFRDINSKIEKCSIIDIYLNNQSKETTNPKRQ